MLIIQITTLPKSKSTLHQFEIYLVYLQISLVQMVMLIIKHMCNPCQNNVLPIDIQ